MKTVLITGATGYVGTTLVKAYLEQGFQVVATARTQENLDALAAANPGRALTTHALDVTDAAATDAAIAQHQPDIIVHASAFPRRKMAEAVAEGQPFEESPLYQLNANGARNVAVAASHLKKPVHLCLVSSGAAFQQQLTHVNLASPRDMENPFARSKNIGEKLVEEALADAPHVATSVLYSPVILDKEQVKGIIPFAADKALKGEPITNNAPTGAGMNFVLADDFGKMVLGVTTRQTEGFERYPVNGFRIPTQDLLTKVASAVRVQNMGKTAPVVQGPTTANGMPQADESKLRGLLGPDFEWQGVDATVNSIVKARIELARAEKPKRSGGVTM